MRTNVVLAVTVSLLSIVLHFEAPAQTLTQEAAAIEARIDAETLQSGEPSAPATSPSSTGTGLQ